MKCMRLYCNEERWEHPEQGRLCLCQGHAEEVFRGEAKAPPLRQNLDYYSGARKTFLVEDVLPNGNAQGSVEDQSTWWTCSVCGYNGPYVGTRPDEKKGCLGSCGGRTANPDSTWSDPSPEELEARKARDQAITDMILKLKKDR